MSLDKRVEKSKKEIKLCDKKFYDLWKPPIKDYNKEAIIKVMNCSECDGKNNNCKKYESFI